MVGTSKDVILEFWRAKCFNLWDRVLGVSGSPLTLSQEDAGLILLPHAGITSAHHHFHAALGLNPGLPSCSARALPPKATSLDLKFFERNKLLKELMSGSPVQKGEDANIPSAADTPMCSACLL